MASSIGRVRGKPRDLQVTADVRETDFYTTVMLGCERTFQNQFVAVLGSVDKLRGAIILDTGSTLIVHGIMPTFQEKISRRRGKTYSDDANYISNRQIVGGLLL
jgi:hypothetical protein